ncbi:uncharacterized protein LOC142777501 isoform X2 [Rhipicephalus microplus]|uniref:uncharacterized protein LOC142777501 isoform X2 n=1 Tax=Rhipicephalus microplus TaxID=6941 RepID=UPI003F6C0C05
MQIENEELKKKLENLREVNRALRSDCRRYMNKLIENMKELESLKELHSSTCKTLTQERDEARKAHEESKTALESVEASMIQYQALLQERTEAPESVSSAEEA